VGSLPAALNRLPHRPSEPASDRITQPTAPREVKHPAVAVRGWIRGLISLPMLPGIDLRQLPESELRQLVRRQLTRGVEPIYQALIGHDVIDERVEQAVAAVYENKEVPNG
jgi:hypothetical protein